MNQKDVKIIEAMKRYDTSAVGSKERIEAARAIEKTSAGISERDYNRIVREYEKEKGE